MSAEGRRQKAEGRRQKAEGRRQKAEVGFVMWDRRTTLAPAVKKIKKVLKEYAMKEPKMANALKHVGLT